MNGMMACGHLSTGKVIDPLYIGLSHGIVDKDPPHNHYIKYKRIYGILNNIDWENT